MNNFWKRQEHDHNQASKLDHSWVWLLFVHAAESGTDVLIKYTVHASSYVKIVSAIPRSHPSPATASHLMDTGVLSVAFNPR